MEVQLLDCTLRDGGYVNNWEFGGDGIEKIIGALLISGIDFIECGFLKPQGLSGTSLFDGIFCGENPVFNYIQNFSGAKFTLMLNAGEYNVDEILDTNIPHNVYIRIAFRKNLMERALADAKKLVTKGVNVFVNPMFTNIYSVGELNYLINRVNKINPYAFCITDTAGGLRKAEAVKLAKYVDSRLNPNIRLDFHSHNNLNLSLENAKVLAGLKLMRGLILDCCVAGMGRGAGNLDTVKISEWLKKYNNKPLKDMANRELSLIYKQSPWGVSYALYQSGRLFCHPDYALRLEKSNVNQSEYKRILASIPEEFKYKYDETCLIKNIQWSAARQG